MKNKSAKDLAFDKERAKYGKHIRELESELKQKDREIGELRDQILQVEEKCQSLRNWIDRLLEYTEMSEEDMKKIIQKEKDSAEVMEHLNNFFGVTKLLGSSYRY